MASRGLLSRVGAARAPRTEPIADSIVEHLRVLLNARRGECATAPAFGIPDFADLVHEFPSSIEVLKNAIQAAVEKYEPRLKILEIDHLQDEDEDPLTVRFQIRGRLVEGRTLLELHTSVNPGGLVQVSKQ